MADLILHIGSPKTGTTSLQAFFCANRDRLGDAGVIYADMPYGNARADSSLNGAFLLEMQRQLRAGRGLDDTMLSCLVRLESLGRGGGRVLLSEENLFLPDVSWKHIAALLDHCGFDNVTAIAYIRSQDAFLDSMWKQACKGGYDLKISSDLYSFSQSPFYSACASYVQRLAAVEFAFGANSLTVRRFDRSRFEGGSIYRDFCVATGIPWNDSFQIPADRNLSVSCDVAMAMRELTLAGLPQVNSGDPGRALLMGLSEELSQRFPDEKGSFPMEPDARGRLMEGYAIDNLLLSGQFFGGEPFGNSAPGAYPVWRPDPARTQRMVAELYAALADRLGRTERPASPSVSDVVELAGTV